LRRRGDRGGIVKLSHPSDTRPIVVYEQLMRAYPRRFRARYGHAVAEAFALELARVRSTGSRRDLIWFWVFMLADLVASVAATRLWDMWRRVSYATGLVRGSSGFSAAFTTLIVIPVWAWSRFATDDGTHTRTVALSFCVSAVAASVSLAVSRLVSVSYNVRRIRSPRFRYASVRRAKLLAVFAKTSLGTFAAASAAELRRVRASEVFVNQAVSGAFWVSLAAALGALIVLYFALDALLHCCGRGSPADAHASF
jgi:hypothetical protein